ncbi:MAG TPA: hypothetical protein VN345_19645 [Blastocatellia bacterium]|jgi:hypothetical protein|nr:hypothetical protein [Blastocatellia bacterium]
MLTRNVWFELKAASLGVLKRPVVIVGFLAAVMGPILFLTASGRGANGLPWYVWMIAPLLLLSVMSAGFLMFALKRRSAGDISISPKNR